MSVELVKINKYSNTYKFKLRGNVFADTSSEFAAKLKKAIKNEGLYIILDFTDLQLIDSTGLSAIVTAIKLLKSIKKGQIFCLGVSENIGRILELTKINKFLKIYNTEEEIFAEILNLLKSDI